MEQCAQTKNLKLKFNSFTDIDFGNVAYVRYYFGAHSSRDIEPSLSCNTEEFLSKNFPRVETHDWGVKGCRTVDTFNFPETAIKTVISNVSSQFIS